MTAWWQSTVFYQIYPRSFMDSNGDGIGDLRGIINKLDYLQWLGIQGIWLSPHYPSPQIDVGYDVADYSAVNPEYGTLEDFQEFVDESHKRGIRVIIDVVLNHTSDQHDWFKQSRSSKNNPKRDWYIWRDGDGDNPPNNWESTFGGSAWTRDEATGQYYYHYFLKEQPDLNWRNPEVRQAVFDSLRFWLDMGVDGFRLDAIGTIFEDPDLTPHNSEYHAYDVLKAHWLGKETGFTPEEVTEIEESLMGHQRDLPEIHDLMRELRTVADEYDDRFLIGETRTVAFLGTGKDQLHAVFNFDIMAGDKITPDIMRENQAFWIGKMPVGAWYSNTLNNHDQSRIKTHFGDGAHDDELARINAAIVLTLPGTPFLYYGEEIGMTDYAVQSFDEVRDMVSMVYRDIMRKDGKSDDDILADLATFSRDRCRTPMQWDNSANAGFSPDNVDPWLPVHENYADGVNVAAQENDGDSLLSFYRGVIAARKALPALQHGDYNVVDENNEHIYAFVRRTDLQHILVALNFSSEPQTLAFDTSNAHVIYSYPLRDAHLPAQTQLVPFEVLIAELD